ncbi:hypothetical protein EKK58_04390 [Candidatus Dependentiae bacterium]|nr:MAG: hypothetical protein EKK58_04390 [Candidatus Dependentiae bacterium]
MSRGRGRQQEPRTYSQQFLSEVNTYICDLQMSLNNDKETFNEIKKHCDDMLIYTTETATRVKAKRMIQIINDLFLKIKPMDNIEMKPLKDLNQSDSDSDSDDDNGNAHGLNGNTDNDPNGLNGTGTNNPHQIGE